MGLSGISLLKCQLFFKGSCFLTGILCLYIHIPANIYKIKCEKLENRHLLWEDSLKLLNPYVSFRHIFKNIFSLFDSCSLPF